MLDKIEQAVFFPIVRIFGVIIASISFIAILIGIIFALTFDPFRGVGKGNYISFDTIKEKLEPDTTSKPNIKIPDNVKKFGENSGWDMEDLIEELDDKGLSTKEKQELINNLSDIIRKAAAKDPESVEDYVEAFFDLIEDSEVDDDALGISKFIKSNVSPIVQPVVKSVVKVSILFGVCLLFILFTVVVMLLLLLSIERNSRKDNK